MAGRQLFYLVLWYLRGSAFSFVSTGEGEDAYRLLMQSVEVFIMQKGYYPTKLNLSVKQSLESVPSHLS